MTLTPWQRTNLLAAFNYLKDLARASKDARSGQLAQGLYEVLDPTRRTIRLQKEAAQAATAAVSVSAARERRMGKDRRAREDRRRMQDPINSPDRRSGRDRRSSARRRSS